MGWTAPIGSVAIENVPAESLKVGDVIVFRPPSSGAPRQLVMHRIISLEQIEGQRVFGTKGDANQGPDPWKLTIGGDGGRLAYVVPYMGYLLWLFQTRMRWVFVSLPLVAYLGFAALRRIWVPAPSGDTPRVQV
jgi:signal peptidase I